MAFCVITVALWIRSIGGELPPERQEFNQFWSTFRQATLQRDWRKLEELASFPLTVRGVLDRDPIRRVGRDEFPRIFDRFLKEGVFSANEQLEFIRRTTTVGTAAHSRDNSRVGDMVFKKTASGWHLHTLYLQYTLD
jgi:hypothetical protein